MTDEQKDLLYQDLCGRLPYMHLMLQWNGQDYNMIDIGFGRVTLLKPFMSMTSGSPLIEEVKPYLRPMSSMTEKEKDELYTTMDWYGAIDENGNVETKGNEKVYRETFYQYIDWLNTHNFDYRGLIEQGLALEAPDGMYN